MASDFLQRLERAIQEALSGRDLLVFTMWIGLLDGEEHNLSRLGAHFGISRERARQLIMRAIQRIRSKGLRQLRSNHADGACAEVLTQLTEVCPLSADPHGAASGLVSFCESELEHLSISQIAIPLLVRLVLGQRPLQDTLIAICRSELARRTDLRKSELRANSSAREANKKVLALADKADWPFDPAISKIRYEWFQRARDVESQHETSGEFLSEKMGRSIQYESNLERKFLMLLESASVVKFYFEQPFAIPYQYEGTLRTYFPDVLVELTDGRTLVVELKPTFAMPLSKNQAKYAAARRHCNERGWGFVMTDLRRTLTDVRVHDVPQPFQQALLEAVNMNPLDFPAYKSIAEKYQASFLDMAAVTVQEGLVWDLGPFRLWKP